MLEVENLPKDIVDPKNKIIKKASKDCLRSLGLGIVIRKSFFDLYPAENIYLKTLKTTYDRKLLLRKVSK